MTCKDEVERIVAAGLGEAAGGGAEGASERKQVGERVRQEGSRQRERGGRVDMRVEEEILDRVREDPGIIVEEVMGSSGDGILLADATPDRSSTCTSAYVMDSLTFLVWVGLFDLVSLPTYHYLTITMLCLLACDYKHTR